MIYTYMIYTYDTHMIHIVQIESKKAIYDIGTEILLKKLECHKHIKNWEIENVKT